VILVAAQQGKGSAPTGSDLGGGAPLATGAVRAPDISAMTPRERVDRLYDRVMRLVEEGKSDSAAFFSSMAVGAYADLGPLDNDLRYDFGRMAEVAGELDVAKAQADSILQSNPDHLLGLALAARVAERRGNAREQRRFLDRLVAAQATEMAKNLDEYVRHRADIEAAAKARQ
jgi:single-stranded DNA-specific DHH superfamily exonuclease